MRIKELAQATGVEVDTNRYYEKQGLLPEPARQDNGYRDYASTHLERLAFIRHCRALEMPLADIRRLLKERPDAIGLAVPGMPVGSPGMDGPAFDNLQDPYDVLLINHDGGTQVFNSYFKQKERS